MHFNLVLNRIGGIAVRRTSFCFLLLLFSGFFLATGFAQNTGHYTIHLTPQAVQSPTPAHTPSVAPARLTSQQKSG
jgi:hypothetical protein